MSEPLNPVLVGVGEHEVEGTRELRHPLVGAQPRPGDDEQRERHGVLRRDVH